MKKNIALIGTALVLSGSLAYAVFTQATSPAPLSMAEVQEINAFRTVVSDGMAPIFPNFFYNVESRFRSTITKSDLQKAEKIDDFLANQCQGIVSYDSVRLIVLDDARESREQALGTGNVLTVEQLALINGMDYSTNFKVRAHFTKKNWTTGELEKNYMTPHMTVVPEKEAQYVNGKEALVEYLKNVSLAATAMADEDKLEPGTIYFTVTPEGRIDEVELTVSCGYPTIDQHMIQTIRQSPGKWIPAENAEGEHVAQKLVLSYGKGGC